MAHSIKRRRELDRARGQALRQLTRRHYKEFEQLYDAALKNMEAAPRNLKHVWEGHVGVAMREGRTV